jgi:type IV secretory pathway VirB6-like protein
MSVILGLLILCLGLYFLSLFFQLTRLEKGMTEGVTLLEKYMMTKYSLGDDGKKKAEAAAAMAAAERAQAKQAGASDPQG